VTADVIDDFSVASLDLTSSCLVVGRTGKDSGLGFIWEIEECDDEICRLGVQVGFVPATCATKQTQDFRTRSKARAPTLGQCGRHQPAEGDTVLDRHPHADVRRSTNGVKFRLAWSRERATATKPVGRPHSSAARIGAATDAGACQDGGNIESLPVPD